MGTETHLVWLDCDFGTDDAAALLCAHGARSLMILGISTLAGNVEGEKTYKNALRLNRLLGTDYPVFPGAEKPLLCPLVPDYRFHGEDGMGGTALPLPEKWEVPAEKAWDALYRTAAAHPGELELIATGPLTNVALALTLHPDLRTLLRRIVIMGGAAVGGNKTPAAEFNIHTDPHAAKAVFEAGVPLTMCGLDVTNKAWFSEAELEAVGACGTPAARFFAQSLRTPLLAGGLGTVRLHDVTAVLYVSDPGLFTGKPAGVRVETRGTVTRGKTVTDLWSDRKFPLQNAFVVLTVDRPGFVRRVSDLIRNLPG